MDGPSTSYQQRFVEVMSGRASGVGPGLLRAAASVGSAFYRAAIGIRNARYDAGRGVQRLDRPVVSVGNISVGGTGKTVLVAEIAGWLTQAGHRVAILMRGYKGADSPVGSDEAAMLRQLLAGVRVEANPNRIAAGRKLLAGPRPPDVFVLDDGFQHRRLHRDLDIVAIDATMDLDGPLGLLLPRGLLREPVESVRRADLVVVTRADQTGQSDLVRLVRRIAANKPGLPVLLCRHVATKLICGRESRPLDHVRGKRFLAFCGIGNPENFARTLEQLGGQCVELAAFDDHHVYTAAELAGLAERARSAGAELILTTEKDYVKLGPAAASPPIWAVGVRIEWLGSAGEAPLREAVLGLMSKDDAGTPGRGDAERKGISDFGFRISD